MKGDGLNSKVVLRATKWSGFFQLVSKIVAPITILVLARLILPADFGVVTAITMLLSFADMLSDAGLHKVLIQNEYESEHEKEVSLNSAFWTNLFISLIIWFVIFAFRHEIARLLGSPQIGLAIVIASVRLPITSFSSIQSALFIRDLNYKGLFFLKIPGLIVPFVITIPLALAGFGYWALIFGALASAFCDAVFLSIYSKWRPNVVMNFTALRVMLERGKWSFLESLTLWLTTWLDGIILVSGLSVYFLGLYKTSQSVVNSVMILFTSMVYPVLFATLSRFQENHNSFNIWFLKMQNFLAYLVLPVGVLFFAFDENITYLVLGGEWKEASRVIGIWALTSSIRIVFVSINSEAYRASGRFKMSFFLQLLDLTILIPVCLWGITLGFWWLVFARSLVRFVLIIPSAVLMSRFFNISFVSIISNLKRPLIAVTLTYAFTLILNLIIPSRAPVYLGLALGTLAYIFIVLIIDRDKVVELKKLILRL